MVVTATSLTTRAVCLATGVAILRALRALLWARVIIPLLLEHLGVRPDFLGRVPHPLTDLFGERDLLVDGLPLRDLLVDLPLECLTIFGVYCVTR